MAGCIEGSTRHIPLMGEAGRSARGKFAVAAAIAALGRFAHRLHRCGRPAEQRSNLRRIELLIAAGSPSRLRVGIYALTVGPHCRRPWTPFHERHRADRVGRAACQPVVRGGTRRRTPAIAESMNKSIATQNKTRIRSAIRSARRSPTRSHPTRCGTGVPLDRGRLPPNGG
jgi:hypothetical protein